MEQNICLNWPALITEAKLRRKKQKFSVVQLATLAGVNRATVTKLEKGDTSITLESAIKIFKQLGLTC